MEFILSAWKDSDLEHFVLIANNYKIAKNLANTFPFPYTIYASQQFIDMTKRHSPLHIKAIDIEGTAVGGIGIHAQSDIMCKNAEIGFWLDENLWERGIMTKALKQMVNYGFEQFDINRIYGRVYHNNLGSQSVLKKAGFQLEGQFEKTIYKFDEYLDKLIYAKRKSIKV